jgi:soluble lytic murein transglycosylase-like protein
MKAARLLAVVVTCWLAAMPNVAEALSPSRAAEATSVARPDALVELGLRYQHAEGVPRDYDRAVALFCEAGAKGSNNGPYNLGVMRLNGRGVERSETKAIYWLQLARARGHEHAAVLLQRLRAEPEPDRALCRRGAPNLGAKSARALHAPAAISALVGRLAPEFQLDPELVTAVIAVESGYRADAVSPKNAQGLMQLIPATAARFGVKDAFDPVQNVRGGMMYLRSLLQLFEGDVTLALAAYNAGEGAVLEHGGVPPYPETNLYLEKLRRYYDRLYHPLSSGEATTGKPASHAPAQGRESTAASGGSSPQPAALARSNSCARWRISDETTC